MKNSIQFIIALFIIHCSLFIKLDAQHLQLAGGFIQVNNSSLVLQDMNFVNNGTFSSTAGNVEMIGTTTTTIDGTSTTTFSTLTINKTSGEVQLNQDAGAADNLQFHSGMLDVQTSNFTMGSSATITAADASKHVQTSSSGYLVRPVGVNNVDFPVGNSSYNPAILTNIGTSDNFSVRVEDQVLETYAGGSPETADIVNRAWYIQEGTTAGSDVTMTLQWNTAEELAGFDRTQSGIAAWDGALWDKVTTYTTATANGTTWTQTRNNITDFTTPFAIEDIQAELGAKNIVEVKVFLQGPFDGTSTMYTNLQTAGLVPLNDPFGTGESATSIGVDIVDWIQIEMRDPTDATNIIATKSALLRNDGQIVSLDGTLGVAFNNLGISSAYIAVRHRNHLGVMTSSAVSF